MFCKSLQLVIGKTKRLADKISLGLAKIAGRSEAPPTKASQMQWRISGDEELDPAGFLSWVRLEAYLGKLDPARGVSREIGTG